MGRLGLFIEEIAEKTTKNNQYEVLTSSQMVLFLKKSTSINRLLALIILVIK